MGEYSELRNGKRKNYQDRETKASAFNIGEIFRTKERKEEELPRIHKSRERAVIYMETKKGKDWGSSGQSYQRCQKR